MVDSEKLSSVLAQFARTVITDFPIQRIVDHLVERIVGVLPITAAGVTLIVDGENPFYIAASDKNALWYEKLQSKLGEGPCVAAFQTGEAVSVPDLAHDERFPQFAAEALNAGLAAIFTFPLRHNGTPLGALDLYRSTPGQLDAQDMEAAQTLADVATAYLLNAQARDAATVTSEAFHHDSLHDALTGLPNRQLLEERLEHAALRAKRTNANAAVLFVDLDRFKDVNDTYGHHVGDALLLAVTDRLRHLVRSGDTLARVSGDEFVILCEDINSTRDVEVLAERIGESLKLPFPILSHSLAISASVGIAYSGPDDDITDQLVITADMAMYQVKRKGGAGHQVLDIRAASDSISGHHLESDLRKALAGNDLEVAYQPLVRTTSKEVIGVEALIRWTHPSLGPIEPLVIIALAERSGLINDIGSWVLRRACHDHRIWVDAHPGIDLNLSVNVSARQLLEPGFVSRVADALAQWETSPKVLVLEVTENIFIDDKLSVSKVLETLDQMGVRIALDDYGTGFSSLSYLARLPIHILKIDRCFIADLAQEAGRTIVASVITLAHNLGQRVVAEGVETAAQHDIVMSLGCDFAQGFLYGKPMWADQFAAFLADRNADYELPAFTTVNR